tara:strand:- start:994 stop:1440 length:447 start_codon:yes stop_codon:yes gene_type:complete
MRQINLIVVHCSATPEGVDYKEADIDKWHKARGWRGTGYHYVVDLDGTIEVGRPEAQIGAHSKGHNANSIGVCYIGGVDSRGKSKDTRTLRQHLGLSTIISKLHNKYLNASVVGHRDLSLDIDGDGIVQKHEWTKDCPCFNVKDWYYG